MKAFISSICTILAILATSAFAAPQATKIFIYGETEWGENLYIRGGLDWNYAATYLNRDCANDNFQCAIAITHRLQTQDANRINDRYLDWHGAEPGQGNVAGSPAVWTTNDCNHATVVYPEDLAASCNTEATVAGYGFTKKNQWGAHYWLLDIYMECDATVNSWFELKTYIQNGAGWETDVSDVEAQWASGNHFARCGYVNVFQRNSGAIIHREAIANQPPTIVLEYPEEIGLNETLTLDASGSFDPEADALEFEWSDGTEGPTYTITFDREGEWSITLEVSDTSGNVATETVIINVIDAPPSDWLRTVILIYGKTNTFQQLTLLGGLDHSYVLANYGENCTQENKRCAVPIRHRVLTEESNRANDHYLDWYGAEPAQVEVMGSPLSWTTSDCHHSRYVGSEDGAASCNPNAQESGYGYSQINTYGDHYWLFDVDMDCSKTIEGWFELKSYISNGAGWESNIAQSEFGRMLKPPFESINHIARCGMINVFQRDTNEAIEFKPLPPSSEVGALAIDLENQWVQLMDGWVQEAVNRSNDILRDPRWTDPDRAAFFESFFARYPLTDDLRNYLVYPLIYWFDYNLHVSMQTTLGAALANRLGEHIGTDASQLNERMYADQDFRETVFSMLHLIQEIMNHGVLTSPQRIALDQQVVQRLQQVPDTWNTNITYNSATEAHLSMLRVHVLGYLNEALPLTPERMLSIQDFTQFEGSYLDLWENYQLMVHDNHRLSDEQLQIVLTLIQGVPQPLAVPRNMSVNDFIADDRGMIRTIPWMSAVNIVGLDPGAVIENGFPSDVAPFYADVFTLVAVHEVNHVVDYHYVRHQPALEARKHLLIEKAGSVTTNYLRSMIEAGYFVRYPQEFLASISNQWFTSTRHTFEIARVRALAGNVQPLNQFLLFAEIYSQGSDSVAGFNMDTSGNIDYLYFPITRDAQGFIDSIVFEDGTFYFTYDSETEDYQLTTQ